MNTRLKVICILFAVVYVLIIGDSFVSMFTTDTSFISSLIDAQKPEWAPELHKKIKEGGGGYVMMHLIAPLVLMLTAHAIYMVLSLIYIPIQYYKLIRSVAKDDIFDINNVKRIRKIGNATIASFFLSILFMIPLVNYFFNLVHVDLNSIWMGAFHARSYYGVLSTGLLILLFGEILRIALSLKEEQDLTI